MELHQLRCFVAVAEEGGFNAASARLCMTQPAISYQVKQLERDLDQPLFFRQPRGIALTEAGRVLYQHAQRLFEQVRGAKSAIERLSEGVNGEVRIGAINSVGIHFLPAMLQEVLDKYPGTRPAIRYSDSHDLVDALVAHEVDLNLMANPGPDPRFRQEVILNESVSLVCGPSHPLYHRQSIGLDELKGVDFVSLTPQNPTGQLVRNYLSRAGIHVEPTVFTDNTETVRKMVEVGLGAAFLPEMVIGGSCDGCADGDHRLARIAVTPPLTRQIVLVTWKKLELSHAASAFVEELRDYATRWKSAAGEEAEHDPEPAPAGAEEEDPPAPEDGPNPILEQLRIPVAQRP